MSRTDDDRRQWHRDQDARQSQLDADERRRRTQREAHQAIRAGQTVRALSKIVGAEGVLEYERLRRHGRAATPFSAGTPATPGHGAAFQAELRACADGLIREIACSRHLSREARSNWPAAVEGMLAAPLHDHTRLLHIDAWILQLQRLVAEADARPPDLWNVSVHAAFGPQMEFQGLLRCLYALRAAVLARTAGDRPAA